MHSVRAVINKSLKRTRQILLFLILLLPSTVAAQPGPLVITEHDWTIRAGGKCYGVAQYFWRGDPKYGAGRYTIVYFGTPRFWVRTRAGYLVGPIVVLLGAIGLLFATRREMTEGK